MFPKLGMEVPSQESGFIVAGNVNTKFLSMILIFTISNTLFYLPFCSHKRLFIVLLIHSVFYSQIKNEYLPILSIIFIFKSCRTSS